NEPGILRRHLGTLRIDHDFSEKDRIWGSYNVAPVDQDTSAVSPAAFTGLGLTQRHSMNDTVSISETHLFRPNLINEVRGGFNIQSSYQRSNQTLEQFLTRIGFDSSDIAAYGQVIGPQNLKTYGHPAVLYSSTLARFTNGGRNTDRPLDQSLVT